MNLTYQKEGRNCPVCRSEESQLLFRTRFSKISDNYLLDSYDVVACKTCGFCFADQIPNQGVFDKYYKNMSKYEESKSLSMDSQYDVKRFNQIVEFINSNIKDKNSRIVEIGCATGLLLSLLKKKGFNNLLGIDPSPSCVETIRNKYGIPSLLGTITDLSSIKAESVDLVILVGVLEHIRDLNLALMEIRNVLRSDGKICIVVPDASQYLNGNDAPFQEFSVEHINYFGPGSLINLMISQNFSKVVIDQQVFEVNFNTFTPVILNLFKKSKEKEKQFKYDMGTVTNFKEYIINCYEREKSIHDKIEKINIDKKPLIIWGTGAQTLRLLANSDLSKANIIAFVDSNPKYHGKKLNDISIISPEELKNMKETILISTRAYQNEIEDQIRQVLKLKNTIIKLY